LRLNAFHNASAMLAAATLSGCMATDQNLARTTALTSEAAARVGYAAVSLPDMVDVLPQPALRESAGLGVAEPAALTASSFAGSQPTAAGAGTNIFLEGDPAAPQPAVYSPRTRPFQLPDVEGGDESLNLLIEKYASFYQLPVNMVRRVVRRESNFRPGAYSNGHWGLMQIKHATARGMGYAGPAEGLLDAETNLKYSVKYLAGAWLVAQGNPDLADRLYQRGYYYDAKRMGLLDETGLGRDRVRHRRNSI
jgi:soluble lytic murein transglycosylase-like protein